MIQLTNTNEAKLILRINKIMCFESFGDKTVVVVDGISGRFIVKERFDEVKKLLVLSEIKVINADNASNTEGEVTETSPLRLAINGV